MITRLNMIILMQHNLTAAIDFYEKLGLKKVFYLEGKWAELELGNIKIGLCPQAGEQPNVRTGIVFEVSDIQNLYDQYKEQFNFKGDLIEKVHGKMISLIDPGHNVIDLYQPTPEKLKDLIKKVKEKDDPTGCVKGDACCKKEPLA